MSIKAVWVISTLLFPCRSQPGGTPTYSLKLAGVIDTKVIAKPEAQ